jgi:hypothetical protein
MGKWPSLVLSRFCNTEISVEIESEELNENGSPVNTLNWKGKCNYQDKAKKVWTSDKVLVQVTGTCLIPGDIAPSFSNLASGVVTIFGNKRKIVLGTKARNPDGTVNYTQLELE